MKNLWISFHGAHFFREFLLTRAVRRQVCYSNLWLGWSIRPRTNFVAPDNAICSYKKNNFYESSSLPCCLSSAIRCLFYPPLLSNSVAHISSALWVFAPNHTADVGFILQQTLIFITLRFVVFFRNNIPYNSYRLRRRSKKLMNVK